MSDRLETYYRRLLAVYPREHRLAYEDEMLGVLMAGAEPGRRTPSLGDAADLLRSGLTARVLRGVAVLRGTGWRDAAAVAGLVSALVLTMVAARRVTNGLLAAYYWDEAVGPAQRLLADVSMRTAAWLLVVVALLTGLRRTGVVLAVVATVVELTALASWYDEWRWVGMGWMLVLAPLTVALLAVARHARTPARVLGRAGLLAATAGIVLAGVVAALPYEIRIGVVQVVGYAAAAIVLVAGLRRARPGVRRRVFALVAAVFALPYAQELFADTANVQFLTTVTAQLVLTEVVFLVGVPLLVGLAVLGAYGVGTTVRVSLTFRRADGKSD